MESNQDQTIKEIYKFFNLYSNIGQYIKQLNILSFYLHFVGVSVIYPIRISYIDLCTILLGIIS